MSESWNNRITYAVIALLGLVLIGQRLPPGQPISAQTTPQAMPVEARSRLTAQHLADRAFLKENFTNFTLALAQRTSENHAQAQTTPKAMQSVLLPVQSSNSPRLMQFNLSLSSPKDLKVRQGDAVVAGEVLADRVEARSRLTAQRQALELSRKQIQAKTITAPPRPVSVPTVKSLPPISYAEEEAAIASAAMNVAGAERALALQQENLKTEPLEESSAVLRATVEVQNRQRLLDNQHRKIDAVAMLKDLPPSVLVHEQEVLKQRSAELQQAQAEYQQAQAKLSARAASSLEKLQQLAASLEKARAEQHLAIARLQTKKDQRAYTEYEASVTAARRAEEKNQAAIAYSQQLLEAEQQQRDRSFQLAQIQAKIAEVDNQLSSLSVVTSPYNGVVRRIKIQGQTNNDLSVELTLVVDGSPTAIPSPGSGGSPIGSAPISTN